MNALLKPFQSLFGGRPKVQGPDPELLAEQKRQQRDTADRAKELSEERRRASFGGRARGRRLLAFAGDLGTTAKLGGGT